MSLINDIKKNFADNDYGENYGQCMICSSTMSDKGHTVTQDGDGESLVTKP